MSVTAAKSKAPIESAIVAPINESTTFTPGNTIIFRLGPSDMLYWLIQDSYFVFDIEWKFNENFAQEIFTQHKAKALAVRNSSMFFDNVRLLHAGNEVYYSQYNIAQQFLDLIKTGDDFMKANYHEWLCHKSLEEMLQDNIEYPLLFKPGDNYDADEFIATKRGIIMHVGQILKCFSQVENFPLKYLTQQIELRLQLAQPNQFVCGISNTDTNNFFDLNGNAQTIEEDGDPSGGASEFEPTIINLSGLSYTIKNMRLYMYGAQVEPSYDAVQSASNATGQGTCWKYQMPRINLRNEPTRKNAQYLISNFQCITENTDEMFIWAVRSNNLAATIRPKVTNCQLKFGPYQMPKSPTEENNWVKPCLYKSLVDDTLEYSTAYYTSANYDLYRSYPTLTEATTTVGGSPHDTHILLAASYTVDDGKPGSNSKAWNSQYNLHYNLELPEYAWTWVLAVVTDYVLTLRSGMLSSTNI